MDSLPSFSSRQMVVAKKVRDPNRPGGKVDFAAYDQINPEKSLLIHDCADWCNDSTFSFTKVFSEAVAFTAQDTEGDADVSAAPINWRKSVNSNIPGFSSRVAPSWPTSKKPPPFQLLAIVNRMDLAAWHKGSSRWEGAELRFVYGSTLIKKNAPGPQDFTLIIEFVLAPLTTPDFRALAKQWFDLSAGPSAAPLSVDSLKKVTAAYLTRELVVAARLRTNSDLIETGAWSFAQWGFRGQLVFEPLDDQIKDGCVYTKSEKDGSDCSEALKKKYWALWNKFSATNPPPESWPIKDVDLLSGGLPIHRRYTLKSASTPREPIGSPSSFAGMPIPPNVLRMDTRARDVLSIQQCRFCHSGETNTQFVHIQNRSGSSIAGLSAFLRGNPSQPSNIKPTIEQLLSVDPKVVHVARVQYSIDNSAGLATSTHVEERAFHDLGRRSLFMAAILSMSPEDKAPSDEIWDATQRFLPTFVH